MIKILIDNDDKNNEYGNDDRKRKMIMIIIIIIILLIYIFIFIFLIIDLLSNFIFSLFFDLM